MIQDVRQNDSSHIAHAVDGWPSLPLAEWQDTYATLHRWTQVIGKLRLRQSTPVNHWWHVPLYVTARGLTTSPMPYHGQNFAITFDFLAHELQVETSWGAQRAIKLRPMSVATFYRETMSALNEVGITVHIWTTPVEVPDPIPFEQDEVHVSYDPEYAQRFWRILMHTQRVLLAFRGEFLGKVSPSHFFWGGFDMAATRFSGRQAPAHPGVPGLPNFVTREAYSHEVSSVGFWPGGYGVDEPIFYAYAYPEPAGFSNYPVEPRGAYYHDQLHEFVLPYEVVRTAGAPDAILMSFLQSSYAAAADLAGWDRGILERHHGLDVFTLQT
jgi:hypothetical protein